MVKNNEKYFFFCKRLKILTFEQVWQQDVMQDVHANQILILK